MSDEQFGLIMQAIRELAGDVKNLDQRITGTESRLQAEIESVRTELKAEIHALREQNSREHEQIRADICSLAEMYGRHELEINRLKKAQ